MSARSNDHRGFCSRFCIRLSAKILRDASQNSLEFVERVPDLEPVFVDAELADSSFVRAGPLS